MISNIKEKNVEIIVRPEFIIYYLLQNMMVNFRFSFDGEGESLLRKITLGKRVC